MSIFYDIFGIELEKVTEGFLNTYFETARGENHSIEYKSKDASLEKICKNISAFLNTNGGILILGSPTEKSNLTIPGMKIQPFVTYRDQFSLNHAINTGITPSPGNYLKIHPVKLDGGFAYVLEIEKSETPPYQVTSSGTYFLRMDTDSRPAPHNVISSLFGYRKTPFLYPTLNFDREMHATEYLKAYINIKLKNISRYSGELVNGYMLIYNLPAKFYKYIDLDDYPFTPVKFEVFGQIPIIVQDMVVENSRQLEFTNNNLLIDFYYYCKDTKLEKMTIHYYYKMGANEIYYSYKDRDEVYNKLIKNYCRFNSIPEDKFVNMLIINNHYLLR